MTFGRKIFFLKARPLNTLFIERLGFFKKGKMKKENEKKDPEKKQSLPTPTLAWKPGAEKIEIPAVERPGREEKTKEVIKD